MDFNHSDFGVHDELIFKLYLDTIKHLDIHWNSLSANGSERLSPSLSSSRFYHLTFRQGETYTILHHKLRDPSSQNTPLNYHHWPPPHATHLEKIQTHSQQRNFSEGSYKNVKPYFNFLSCRFYNFGCEDKVMFIKSIKSSNCALLMHTYCHASFLWRVKSYHSLLEKPFATCPWLCGLQWMFSLLIVWNHW